MYSWMNRMRHREIISSYIVTRSCENSQELLINDGKFLYFYDESLIHMNPKFRIRL
jgi:hypothetical protein